MLTNERRPTESMPPWPAMKALADLRQPPEAIYIKASDLMEKSFQFMTVSTVSLYGNLIVRAQSIGPLSIPLY